LLVAAAAALEPGSGLSASTTMGPLVSAGHRDSVLTARADARREGAQPLYETDVVDAGNGCVVAPAIFEVSIDMEIWRRELFGPVIALTTVDSFEAAIAATNDSDYGLSAAVFTTDLGAAHRFINAAEVGQVAVNLPTSGWDVHQPFGGWKDSGSPFKEHGKHGLRFYTRVKTVALGLGATTPNRTDTPDGDRSVEALVGAGSTR
jgi:alpha-ketoglutaric semialdehyde dehydrogenase